MGIFAAIWLVGLALYFWLTTPRQRENFLLLSWVVLLSPIFYWLVTGLMH